MLLFVALIAAALSSPGWMAFWLVVAFVDGPRYRGLALLIAIFAALSGSIAVAVPFTLVAWCFASPRQSERSGTKALPGARA